MHRVMVVFLLMFLSMLTFSKVEAADRTLFVAGQSLAEPWYRSPIRNSFVKIRKKRGDKSNWHFLVHASGGSAAMRNFNGSIPNNYWYDIDKREIGPQLREAISVIQSAKRKPTEVLWVQGQQEGGMFGRGPNFSMPKGDFKRKYKNSVLMISKHIRQAIAGKDWRSVPFYIQTLGTRLGGDTEGDQLIREAQLEIIAEKGRSWNIRLGGIQPINLPLKDHVHPNMRGEKIMGVINARAIN